MGPPEELILQLKERYKLKNFIETGTYYGNTAIEAASHFGRVITIENSKMLYEKVSEKYSEVKNVNFLYGDSRIVLKEIIPNLEKAAIFWLDGHWCGGDTFGEQDQCPVADEIRIITNSNYEHFLFIDDARLFMSPPPIPNEIEQWPNITKVINMITDSMHNYYIIIFEDVIIAVPEYAKEFVAKYCQEINTQQWKEYNEIQNMPKISQGLKQINQGLRIVIHDLGSKLKNVCSYKK
jgi:hypothetical protein